MQRHSLDRLNKWALRPFFEIFFLVLATYNSAMAAPPTSPPLSVTQRAIKLYQEHHWWQGARLLHDAVTAGDPVAQTNLGLAYLHSQGVFGSVLRAEYWFRKAAAQGFPRAEYLLGYLALRGWGHEFSRTVAMQDFRQAAHARWPAAEQSLGWGYFRGWGVAPNYQKSLYWLHRAVRHGAPAEMDLKIVQNTQRRMMVRIAPRAHSPM